MDSGNSPTRLVLPVSLSFRRDLRCDICAIKNSGQVSPTPYITVLEANKISFGVEIHYTKIVLRGSRGSSTGSKRSVHRTTCRLHSILIHEQVSQTTTLLEVVEVPLVTSSGNVPRNLILHRSSSTIFVPSTLIPDQYSTGISALSSSFHP